MHFFVANLRPTNFVTHTANKLQYATTCIQHVRMMRDPFLENPCEYPNKLFTARSWSP